MEELENKSNDVHLNELQKTVKSLKMILNGTSDLETREINYLLREVIDYIEYKRVGDHRAKVQIKIHYLVSIEEEDKKRPLTI